MFIAYMKVNMSSFLFKYFLPLVVGWLLAFPARAQDTVFYNLGSPYHTINTHLQNLQPDSYHPQVAGKTFNILIPEKIITKSTCNEMGSSSLNILFYIFFKAPSWTEELTCRHQVLLEILKLAEALEVRFAFPTQTLHMETFPGKLSLTPESFQDMKTLREKLDDYFNAKSKNLKRT